MKFYALLLLSGICVGFTAALRCWTCENAKSPRDCFRSGYSKQCSFLEKVCQTEVRYSVGWGKDPIIRTGCKEPHACTNNNIQNPRRAYLPTQCNGGKFNSVCRCCCSGDHCNRKNLLCEPALAELREPTRPPRRDTGLTIRTTPSEPTCRRFPRNPLNGVRLCTNGKYIGSKCAFSCNVGYRLVGRREATCVRGKKSLFWNRRIPICEKEPECESSPLPPKNGKVSCRGVGKLGTECSFQCDDGFEMKGSGATSCMRQGKSANWTHPEPACVSPAKPPPPQCPQIGELRHGNVTCTGQEIGSKCNFKCSDVGYALLPTGRNEAECIEEGGVARWTHRKPCCSATCPPVAKKDITIVIDSSRSISRREWNRMKDFVTEVISSFQVTKETTQFAVYRFNKKVDEESQILFGDYENVDELVEKVKNLPKHGGGTKVGNALRHARDFVLKHSNRKDVADLVWVLTDGKSKDDFHDVAKDLRDSGVEIIALGISRKGEEEFMKQLTAMTGDKDLVIEVKDVLKSFSDSLVQMLKEKICEVSCE